MTRVRNLAPADAPALTALYADYQWWVDREIEDVRRALAETEVAVGLDDAGDLVTAARILTVFTYYANVFDVIVAADRQGEGIGGDLMEAVVAHPDLQDVDGPSLLCRRGLAPYYESVGFELFDPVIDVPEGGREALVRMIFVRDE